MKRHKKKERFEDVSWTEEVHERIRALRELPGKRMARDHRADLARGEWLAIIGLILLGIASIVLCAAFGG